MAFKPLLRHRALVPAFTAGVTVGLASYIAPRMLDAEEPPLQDPHWNRKPIYDDEPLHTTAPTPTPTPAPSSTSSSLIPNPFSSTTSSTPSTADATPYRPTPTDRLAVQIGYARLFLYNQTVKAEDGVNAALTSTLRLERSFTDTIRGLAPPKESDEKIFPGALYVLVSSMAGSIVTRNRNILLRASVPAAIGLTTAYAVLPLTMRNVGDLAWSYESRYPVLADTHLRAKERVERFVETGKAHSSMGIGMLQDKVGETRERLEEWVRKGR